MTLSPNDLRATFDATTPLTVGLEEEVLLLDPRTLEPAPVAARILAGLEGDGRFKAELPAAQLELVTPPCATAAEAVERLAAARATLLGACEGVARPAAVAVPPLGDPLGRLNTGGRYDAILAEYGDVARRQLVSALQVHVALGDADTTLRVYNALRAWLPELAALAANGAYYAGRDTGLASMRPLIGENLPRQGVPPALASWEVFARELEWGAASATVPHAAMWWWELRPHVTHGTLELRVPDAQATIEDVAALVEVAVALARRLAEEPAAAREIPTWRIEENRWSACRHGLDGELADLETGERRPTRDRLRGLVRDLGLDPVALVEVNGAMRQRQAGSAMGAARWAADAYACGG